jgi:hypothetical protein
MAVSGAVAEKYDAVIAHRNVSRRQLKWLRQSGTQFIYDIDDLLFQADQTGIGRRQAAEQKAVGWCLENAFLITSPSRRLLSTLDRNLQGRLSLKRVYLPNAGASEIPPERKSSLPRLLWVSSAEPMYASDIEETCLGIDDALQALRTEILLVGRFPDHVRNMFGAKQLLKWVEPRNYMGFLSTGDFIAVAPLSKNLSHLQQQFADCKSDIKIAQFGSSRIAGAYAAAPPFVESDLPRQIVPSNRRADWADAIRQIAEEYPGGSNRLGEHPSFELRRPQVLAGQFFYLIEQVAAVTREFSFWAIPTPDIGRRVEQQIRRWRSRLTTTSAN